MIGRSRTPATHVVKSRTVQRLRGNACSALTRMLTVLRNYHAAPSPSGSSFSADTRKTEWLSTVMNIWSVRLFREEERVIPITVSRRRRFVESVAVRWLVHSLTNRTIKVTRRTRKDYVKVPCSPFKFDIPKVSAKARDKMLKHESYKLLRRLSRPSYLRIAGIALGDMCRACSMALQTSEDPVREYGPDLAATIGIARVVRPFLVRDYHPRYPPQEWKDTINVTFGLMIQALENLENGDPDARSRAVVICEALRAYLQPLRSGLPLLRRQADPEIAWWVDRVIDLQRYQAGHLEYVTSNPGGSRLITGRWVVAARGCHGSLDEYRTGKRLARCEVIRGMRETKAFRKKAKGSLERTRKSALGLLERYRRVCMGEDVDGARTVLEKYFDKRMDMDEILGEIRGHRIYGDELGREGDQYDAMVPLEQWDVLEMISLSSSNVRNVFLDNPDNLELLRDSFALLIRALIAELEDPATSIKQVYDRLTQVALIARLSRPYFEYYADLGEQTASWIAEFQIATLKAVMSCEDLLAGIIFDEPRKSASESTSQATEVVTHNRELAHSA